MSKISVLLFICFFVFTIGPKSNSYGNALPLKDLSTNNQIAMLAQETGSSLPCGSTTTDSKIPVCTDWRKDKADFESAKLDTKTYEYDNYALIPNRDTFIIDTSEFLLKLEEFSGVRETNVAGSMVLIKSRRSVKDKNLARTWLEQEYKKLNYKTTFQSYSRCILWPGGINFIAEKKGKSGKVIIISSHLDSVKNAGANDDGTGTIAALMVAKAIKDLPNKHTIRFVAFDQEELGLCGSANYVKTLSANTVIADIHLEMMAYNSKADGRFHIIDCDKTNSTFITSAIMKEISFHNLPLRRVAACTHGSDHSSFWKKKIPAAVISDNFFGGDSDPCYHKSCDIVDSRLNYNYATLIVTAVANAVANLIQQ
ncbi:MAG: M28 family peptidase [Oligoflexia bacterium]|nr:M28 family peptidase [Oligoflexia bacterium]